MIGSNWTTSIVGRKPFAREKRAGMRAQRNAHRNGKAVQYTAAQHESITVQRMVAQDMLRLFDRG